MLQCYSNTPICHLEKQFHELILYKNVVLFDVCYQLGAEEKGCNS